MAFPQTFVDLQNEVIDKARLGQTTTDIARVKAYINNAYYEACIETGFYESSSAAAALAANATSVAVPTTVVRIEYITAADASGTLWGPLEEVTFEEMLELRAWSGGVVSTGAPSRYAYRSGGSPTIEFYPQAVGGEVLTFYGELLPTALSADADLQIFGEPWSNVIKYRACIHACEFKKDLLLLNQYQSQYQDWITRFRAFRNARGGIKTQQLRVEGMRRIPQRNDIDNGR